MTCLLERYKRGNCLSRLCKKAIPWKKYLFLRLFSCEYRNELQLRGVVDLSKHLMVTILNVLIRFAASRFEPITNPTKIGCALCYASVIDVLCKYRFTTQTWTTWFKFKFRLLPKKLLSALLWRLGCVNISDIGGYPMTQLKVGAGFPYREHTVI